MGAQATLERVEIGFGDRFRPGVWTPVRLELASVGAAATGTVVVAIDRRVALRFATQVPAGGRRVLQGLLLLPRADGVVSVSGEGGLAFRSVTLRPRAVPDDRAWIAVPLALPAAAAGFPGAEVARIDPGLVPRQEGAWDGLDALVLDRAHRAAIEQDRAARQVLAEWQAHGGVLLETGATGPVKPNPRRLRLDADVADAAALFAVPPWSGERGGRLRMLLGLVLLTGAATALLSAFRSPGRTAAAATVAGTLVSLAWTGSLDPTPAPPVRTLARRMAEGGAVREDAWVELAGPARLEWGWAARSGQRPFHATHAGSAGSARSAFRVLDGAERWVAPADPAAIPCRLHRTRRLAEVQTPRAVRGPGGIRIEGADLADAVLVEAATRRWLDPARDPRPLEAHLGRIARLLADLDPGQAWVVGRAGPAAEALPAGADPVEDLGLWWAVRVE